MHKETITSVAGPKESEELDELLWRVLWKPLDLPRNIRQSFKVKGNTIELVAKKDGHITGGLIAVWTGESEVEISHLAVASNAQHQGIGQKLVEDLSNAVKAKGCRKIHTIARNTSVGFFRKLGFKTASGIPPDHPDFKKKGITFELMEKIVEPPVSAYRLRSG